MMKMIKIGIDPSINSMGVCVNSDDESYKYFLISSAKHRNMPDWIDQRIYNKENRGKKLHDEDIVKNIDMILDELDTILEDYYDDDVVVNIEGPSYLSKGKAAIDLPGLNMCIRLFLYQRGLKVNVVSPMSNKKFATGAGWSKKDAMIEAWRRAEKIDEVSSKVDDVADAYWLSRFE